MSDQATQRDRVRIADRAEPRWRALALLLLVAAALLWWLGLSEPRVSQPTPTAAASSVPVLEPAQPAEPAAEPVAPTAVATPPPPPPPAPAPVVPAAPPPVPVRPPDARGFADALQERFDADSEDDHAGSAEAALRQVLRDAGAPAALEQSIACRHSLCKLQLRWVAEHDAAYHSVVERLMGDNAKFFATRPGSLDATGGMLVDAYWVRR